jgi:carboxylesterase
MTTVEELLEKVLIIKADLQRRLDEIFSPILILHGKYDAVAPLKNVAILKDAIRTRMVEAVILENSRHVAVLDHDKELLGNKIISFLNRFSTE